VCSSDLFDYEYMNEPYNYGKTEFYLVVNQYFDLPHSWLANIYYYYNSGGTQNNIQLKPYQMFNFSIQKSFLQDRLSVKFAARDLFHKMKFEEDTRIRNVHFWQIEDHKYWNFSLSIVYRLNQLKTKYRGKSAASAYSPSRIVCSDVTTGQLPLILILTTMPRKFISMDSLRMIYYNP